MYQPALDESSAMRYLSTNRSRESDMADTCDCCGCTMKHRRLGDKAATRLFVCQECRDVGMKRLGRNGVTALHVGFKQ